MRPVFMLAAALVALVVMTGVAQPSPVGDFSKTVRGVEELDPPQIPQKDVVLGRESGEKPAALSSFEGKPVLLNLWATWCAPCVAELPSLAKLKKARPNLQVVAVSLDLQRKPEDLSAFLTKYQAQDLGLYYDQERAVQKVFPARGLPTTYILSSQGKILYKIEGDTDWTSDVSLKFLDHILSQPTP